MNQKLLIHVGDIVAAHVSSNSVPARDVPHLITTVYQSLAGLGEPVAKIDDGPKPIMTIRASVKPDSIGCFECGRRFKSLRRHLSTHGITADQYRAKWSLPESYPFVAAEYSALRSGVAKASGLGKRNAEG